MNRNTIVLAIAACGMFMASCDTPKDLRPEDKVSVDFVEPGTRTTYNVGKVNEVYPESHEGEVMPDRDLGGNTLQKGKSVKETTKTNTAAGATKE